MSSFIDLTGRTIGRLTVRKRADNLQGRATWLCDCICGNSKVISAKSLTRQKNPTESCGCLHREVVSRMFTTHGRCRGYRATPEYRAWQHIIERCTVQTCKSYSNYGGRGIRVCQRWLDSFENFLVDMGLRPKGKTSIGRYPDNDGNYEPGNCRWENAAEQNRNTRQNVWLTLDGVTLCLEDWSKLKHINPYTVSQRLKAGWSTERALNTPSQRQAKVAH